MAERHEDGGFSTLREKILYLLHHHTERLDEMQEQHHETKVALAGIQKDVTALLNEQSNKRKTVSQFFGEGLKVASAILIAYVLLKLGLA